MYTTYVLWSPSLKKRYIGSTADLQKRLRQHNAGESTFTKRGIPWKVVHTEIFESRHDAEQRERELKSRQGRQWLDNQYPNTIRKQRG